MTAATSCALAQTPKVAPAPPPTVHVQLLDIAEEQRPPAQLTARALLSKAGPSRGAHEDGALLALLFLWIREEGNRGQRESGLGGAPTAD